MLSESRPLTPEDLFQMQFIQGAALSPDGTQVVYILSTYDAEDDKDYSHLWLLAVDTAVSRQLTHGKHNNTDPAWSPDGQQLAFLSTRDEKTQIYLLPTDGGEAQPLTQFDQGVASGPVWSPDGQTIAFTAVPAPEEERDAAQPYRITRSVYRFDGIGYLDTAVQDIYIISTSGGESQQLTDDAAMNSLPQWSPNGHEILYNASMLPNVFDVLFSRLRIVNLKGERRQVVADEWGHTIGSTAWLPDGHHIAFVGQPDGQPIGTKNDLFVVNASGNGTPENRSASYPFGVGGRLQPDFPAAGILRMPATLKITNDGRTAFIQAQRGGTVQILRVALMGPETVTAVLNGDRSCLLLDLSQDERSLLYGVSTIRNPLDLYLSDTEGGNEQQLTAVNTAYLANVCQPNIEHMLFRGKDGAEVEGWNLLPGADSAPYPTILYIHGGPHGAFGHMYHFDMQMLVGAGYAVLIVNHRASTGYGDEFATAIKGDWGNLDYSDLMAGVDEAIAQGWADPERLGVCGLSGGGNLSCWIVGQTDRFKAAVPENPVTNWVSFYGVSDIGVWFSVEELGGHPHEIPETYARCSPITYAHRCTTPTLLVQGEHDWRCPAEQSEQFYNVLKANGCVVEMLRLPQSPHVGAVGGPPHLRRSQNEALLDWMNRYVLGHEPTL